MSTWIFQANPDLFDIDAYLATWPSEFPWLVTRYADRITIGDTVYLWRNRGKHKAEPGIIAEGVITAPAEPRAERPDARRFWYEGITEADAITPRALLRPVRVAAQREVLRRDWLEGDPVLRDLPNLKMAAGTNYPVTEEQADRLRALWNRTGQDWSWDESLAGLWAYAQTYGKPVSRLPGSPVADVSLLIGRPITGVYNKVMNFRALDPREGRAGLSGGGRTDQLVWTQFYDPEVGQLRIEDLDCEFERLWQCRRSSTSSPLTTPREVVEATARKLEADSLEALLARYLSSRSTRPARPGVSSTTVRAFERDPIVIAYARKRASFRCELPDCSHLTFLEDNGHAYCEVHHILPLAEGGADVIENVVCLCPTHHREAHLGQRRAVLAGTLRALRQAQIGSRQEEGTA